MALVLGVDSSTTSTKVELRDADDGHLYASGRAPHGPVPTPRVTRTPASGGTRSSRPATPPAARSTSARVAVAAPSDGLVVVDDDGDVAAARQGRCRHRRRRATPSGWSTSSAATCGARPAARCRAPRRRSRSSRGCAGPSRRRSTRVAKVLTPARLDHVPAVAPLRHRPRRRVGDRLLVAAREPVAARPAVGHRPGQGLGGVPPRGARPDRAGRRPRGCRDRARHRPQPGDRARPRPASRTTSSSSLDRTAGTTCAVRERPTEDPTGAVGWLRRRDRPLPAAGAQLRRRCASSRRSRPSSASTCRRLDQLALGSPPGADGVRLVPFGDGERARRPAAAHGPADRAARRHRAGAHRPRARRGCRVRAPRRPRPAACGRRPRRRPSLRPGLRGAARTCSSACSPTCRSGPVYVPATTDVADTGALGACVQAAAVLHQLDPIELADVWGLQPGARHRARLRGRRRRDPRRLHGHARRVGADPI